MPCRCGAAPTPPLQGRMGSPWHGQSRSLPSRRRRPRATDRRRQVDARRHRAFVLGAHGWVPEALTLIRHGTPREGSGRTRSHGQRRRRVRADGHGEDLTRRLWPGAATCCFRARKRASPRTRTRTTLPHRFRPTGEAMCRRNEPASTAQSESRARHGRQSKATACVRRRGVSVTYLAVESSGRAR
jgi:hypothetical protein